LPAPPGPGYGEIPPWEFGSEPRPVPALAAPEPSPLRPLPGPVPRPMPVPSPDPPNPLLAVPEGDMAKEPGVPLLGTPFAEPGSLETTTPLPPPLPPGLDAGGASTEPASSGPPMPPPRLPLPRRAS
jgi:protein TonB